MYMNLLSAIYIYIYRNYDESINCVDCVIATIYFNLNYFSFSKFIIYQM